MKLYEHLIITNYQGNYTAFLYYFDHSITLDPINDRATFVSEGS